MSEQIIFDRLYGPIEFTETDLQLFQTEPLRRLRHLSLSAAPGFLLPTGTPATKFEHSVGVYHLAKLLTRQPAFQPFAIDLQLAALLHDIGTPPFSHTSELFQLEMLGQNHEQFAAQLLTDPELKEIIAHLGGSVDRISQLIAGELPPWSDLINGQIDVDNLDNTLRYGLSMGLLKQPNHYYDPIKLITHIQVSQDRLSFNDQATALLTGWQRCRDDVYRFVYGQRNSVVDAMLSRAIGLAYEAGFLTPNYFLLSDAEAFGWLRDETTPAVRKLIEQLDRWRWYEPVFRWQGTELPAEWAEKFAEPLAGNKLADELGSKLQVPPEAVAVALFRDKSQRWPSKPAEPTWTLQVCLKDDQKAAPKIKDYFSSLELSH